MDTSGYYPQLKGDDPLYEVAEYSQILKNQLGTSPVPYVPSFTNGTWGAGIAAGSIADKRFYFVNDTAVATTDANGYAPITMPFTFPNGYAVGGAINGDDWARPNITFMISTNIFTNTNNKFYVRVLQNGGTPMVNGVFRINYMVTGW